MRELTHGDVSWNLFARELEDILAARGLRLGHLDDRRDETGLPILHREKVRRLQRSLRVPSFTVLNEEELGKVVQAFGMSADERMRLHAAVLATSIEETLMTRLGSHCALHVAERLLPILRETLEQPVRECRRQ